MFSVVNGVVAFAVEIISSDPSGFFTSHTHPDPKVLSATSVNTFLNSSIVSHFPESLFANSLDGAADPGVVSPSK